MSCIMFFSSELYFGRAHSDKLNVAYGEITSRLFSRKSMNKQSGAIITDNKLNPGKKINLIHKVQ